MSVTKVLSSSTFANEITVNVMDRMTPIEKELEDLKRDTELHKKILRKQNWCKSVRTKKGKRR